MSSDPLELKEARAQYFARWEAVEIFKAQELASMTDERARQIIRSLGAVQRWRERTDWSGLIEQQAIFHRGLITCSAEDLIVHKAFAGRDLDWADVERVLTRQHGKLDLELIRLELKPLLDLKGEPEAIEKLEQKIAIVERRLRSKQ